MRANQKDLRAAKMYRKGRTIAEVARAIGYSDASQGEARVVEGLGRAGVACPCGRKIERAGKCAGCGERV